MRVNQNIEPKLFFPIAGKKVSVLGAARSGIAAARLLKAKGANVFVSDAGTEEKLIDQIEMLRSMDADYEVGGHSERVLDAEIIVLSPGVPSMIPLLEEARNRDIPVVAELEMASWFCRAPIIAITGTNGKTTTTTLVGKMLDDGKKSNVVGGNTGNAFSAFADTLDENTVSVLEVSSFQLDDINTFHPAISLILNITSDHLDRYNNNFEMYTASKCRIFENQTEDDYLIYNYDDEQTCEQVRRLASKHVHTIPFSAYRQFDEGAFVEEGKLVTILNGKRSEIIGTAEIKIRGIHNLYNSMAATLAAEIAGIGVSSPGLTLKQFRGVEHRLEFVREHNGIKYINDSKATNVDSVWYALQAYTEPLIVLIGGRDKGNDYSKLFDLVKKNVKAIIAIGESADKVYDEFHNMKKVIKAASLSEAIESANETATAGDIVLLSPACASFDWFQNYEQRGRMFKEIVNNL